MICSSSLKPKLFSRHDFFIYEIIDFLPYINIYKSLKLFTTHLWLIKTHYKACPEKSFGSREPEQIISVCYTLVYVLKLPIIAFYMPQRYFYFVYLLNLQKKCLLFSNYASWSSIISVCLVKISVCSGKISVWYTFPGKISVCSRSSRGLGSPGSGFLTAWLQHCDR